MCVQERNKVYLERLARNYLRQRARGIDPRPPESGVEKTRFGEIKFKISGAHYKHAEISVTGNTVSLISVNNKDLKYSDVAKNITPRVAEAVLTELIINLKQPTKDRKKWLKKHPQKPIDDWSEGERIAAALLYALSTYSEEQRTHGGKAMRGGMRSIAEGRKKGTEVFAGKNPLIPQTAKVQKLRDSLGSMLGGKKTLNTMQDANDISVSSDVEDEEHEWILEQIVKWESESEEEQGENYGYLKEYENGIATKKNRKNSPATTHTTTNDSADVEKIEDPLTEYVSRRRSTRLAEKRLRDSDDEETIANEAPKIKRRRTTTRRNDGDGPVNNASTVDALTEYTAHRSSPRLAVKRRRNQRRRTKIIH